MPTVRYSRALGETFVRITDGVLETGLIAGEHLANDNFGIVHGGALATFADMALGCAVGLAVNRGVAEREQMSAPFVTAQLQVQFTAAARVGDFIVCRPEVVRATSQLVFVRGLFAVDGRTVLSADGIFKLLDAAKVERLKAD